MSDDLRLSASADADKVLAPIEALVADQILQEVVDVTAERVDGLSSNK